MAKWHPWTEEEEKLLRDLWAGGQKSLPSIASALRLTLSQIKYKLDSMGLIGRVRPKPNMYGIIYTRASHRHISSIPSNFSVELQQNSLPVADMGDIQSSPSLIAFLEEAGVPNRNVRS